MKRTKKELALRIKFVDNFFSSSFAVPLPPNDSDINSILRMSLLI